MRAAGGNRTNALEIMAFYTQNPAEPPDPMAHRRAIKLKDLLGPLLRAVWMVKMGLAGSDIISTRITRGFLSHKLTGVSTKRMTPYVVKGPSYFSIRPAKGSVEISWCFVV